MTPWPGPGSRVVVVSCPSDWAGLATTLRRHTALLPVLGMDCEWVSEEGRARPVALLQLATAGGLVVLARLLTCGPLPPDVRRVLADPEVFKVGVAVAADSRKLLAGWGLEVGGCVDLRHLAVEVGGAGDRLGLEGLADSVLGIRLDKEWGVRAGDWEAATLDPRQVAYAANDALVAVAILWELLHTHFTATWAATAASLLWDEARLVAEVAALLARFVDLEFSSKEGRARAREGRGVTPPLAAKGRHHNSTRKSPLYHNCMLQAPDGQVLCTCDTKKARWYVAKGIGEVVTEEPLVVRLRFEPSGRPDGKAGEYYLSVKPNICVVCGASEAYLRKNVVPHEYRRYFPAVMKDHQSHDVLLM